MKIYGAFISSLSFANKSFAISLWPFLTAVKNGGIWNILYNCIKTSHFELNKMFWDKCYSNI